MPEATGADRRRQSQELNIFHDVAKALTSSLDLDSILQTIMEKMAEYFHPETWSLLMVDEEHNELYFAIAVGDAAEALKDVRLKVGEGIAGWVAKNGEQLIVPDVYTDARFAKRIDEVTQWETRSIICIPLNSKHRVLGVIQLVNVDMKGFGDQEIFFLRLWRLRCHALRTRARRKIRNSPSPTTAPAFTTRAISTRRSKPRSTVPRVSDTSSAYYSSISTTSSR
jgi:signal transduction protein with GAF and PtsI domain